MKETKKQFFRYDKHAEDKVKMRYEHIITLVNVWAIPLMRIFGEPVTLNNVRTVMKDGIKEHFVSVLISRKVDNPKAFAAMIDYKPTAEKLFADKLKEVVRATDKYKAVEGRKTMSRERKEWECSRMTENAVYAFSNCADLYNSFKGRTLESALSDGKIVWGKDCIKFDDAKIQADCALYLEGEEIAFVAGLEKVAKAINEAYKGGLSDLHNIVYLLDCKDGKAVLNPDKIDLVDIMRYGTAEM